MKTDLILSRAVASEDRRGFLVRLGLGAALFTVPGAFAEELIRTPKQTEGPFYPGRTRHIHFAIKMKGHAKWTTQCYVKGEPQNERDGIYKEIKDPKARDSVTVDFAPVNGSRIGELAAKFDIVMGFTPEA